MTGYPCEVCGEVIPQWSAFVLHMEEEEGSEQRKA